MVVGVHGLTHVKRFVPCLAHHRYYPIIITTAPTTPTPDSQAWEEDPTLYSKDRLGAMGWEWSHILTPSPRLKTGETYSDLHFSKIRTSRESYFKIDGSIVSQNFRDK